jgi:hypothetical protein
MNERCDQSQRMILRSRFLLLGKMAFLLSISISFIFTKGYNNEIMAVSYIFDPKNKNVSTKSLRKL